MERTHSISSISLNELELFTEVARTRSIRESARRYHMEPGQLSRTIKRLESKIGTRLLERNPAGISLTAAGTQVLKTANEILREADELSSLARGEEMTRTYGIGAVSFLNARVLGPIVGQMTATSGLATPQASKAEIPDTHRFHLIDVAPDQMIISALKGAYDLALHVGHLDWPKSWNALEVGSLKWQLFARKGLPVAQRTNQNAIRDYSYILPAYWTNEGLTEGNDQCPLKSKQRKAGALVSSGESALSLLKASNHLAFLPEILARESVRSGELTAIHVREWKAVVKPLYLAVRSDVVPNRLYTELISRLKQFI